MLPSLAPVLDRHPMVRSAQAREIIDSLGDPAVEVDLEVRLRDGELRSWDELKPIEDEVFQALRQAGDERFAYVWFHSNG